jgi:hypothetical protein
MAWFTFAFGVGDEPVQQELEAFEAPDEARSFALGALRLMVCGRSAQANVSIGVVGEDASVGWIGTYILDEGGSPVWQADPPHRPH